MQEDALIENQTTKTVPQRVKPEIVIDSTAYGDPFRFEDYLIAAKIPAAEITKISAPTIVSLSPLAEQVEAFKTAYGEEDFYVVADDNNYYAATFEGAFDTVDLAFTRPQTRYIKFNWSDTTWVLDRFGGRVGGLAWDYFLFNGQERPRMVEDLTLVDVVRILQYFEADTTLAIFRQRPDLWSFPAREIDRLLTGTDCSNDTFTDEVVVTFLEEYVESIEMLNQVLFDYADYEVLNSIIWADEALHEEEALRFEEAVKEYGYQIAITEGSIYLERNPEYIKRRMGECYGEAMNDFFVMYTEEVNRPVSQDGGIVLPLDQLVDRAVYWERFMKGHPTFAFGDYTRSRAKRYLYFLLEGLDNTPAFSYSEGHELLPVFRNAMEYALQKYPSSDLAKVVKEYQEILAVNDFRSSDESKAFADRYRPW